MREVKFRAIPIDEFDALDVYAQKHGWCRILCDKDMGI